MPGERLSSLAWAAVLGLLVCLNTAAIPAIYLHMAAPPPAVAESLHASGLGVEGFALYMTSVQAVFGLLCIAAATAIWWQLPSQTFPRFVAVLLVLSTAASPPNLDALVSTFPVVEPLARLAQVLFVTSLIAFPFLFPTGNFVPRWTRLPTLVLLATLVVASFALGGSLSDPPDPVGALTVIGFAGGLAAMVYRFFRRSGPVQRQQTKWVVASGSVVFAVTLFDALVLPQLPSPVPAELRSTPFDPVSVTLMSVVYALLPVSLCLAILRLRLWDIDAFINRALVYGALSAVLLGMYALVVTLTGAVARGQATGAAPLVATLLVALAVRPLHARLQRLVSRLLYGDRDEPYVALTRLGQQLESTLSPAAVLPAIVRGITEALRVPHAGLEVHGNDGLALCVTEGHPTEPRLRLPITYQTEMVGELVVSPRAPGERFSASDRRLLQDLARQAGVAVHAVLIAADLERARLKLVLAREAARRQLGSDLHDGLSHRLTGLLRSTEHISNVLGDDSPVARDALHELAQQARTAIHEVRELAHRLHPPELDLYGLVGALREQADRHTGLTPDGLRVSVEAPADLPRVPAAVELTAYLIACEALTNVERHAAASRCWVRVNLRQPTSEHVVELTGAPLMMELEIVDNGRGLDRSDRRIGLGIASMRERAAELGGSCEIEPAQPHGTQVRVRLPCLPVD